MLALLFTLSVALPPNTQQAQAPTTKQLIAFFNELKKEPDESTPPFEIPDEYKKEEKKLAEFAKSLEELKTPYPTDSPEKIGGRWLAMLDSTLIGPTKSSGRPESVLRAIPHPDAWPTIAAGLRKNFGSRTTPLAATFVLYGELLAGTPQSQRAAFAKLKGTTMPKNAKSRLDSLGESVNPKSDSANMKPPSLASLLQEAKTSTTEVDITPTHWDLAKQDRPTFFKKLFTESKATIKPYELTPAQTAQLVAWCKESAPKHRVGQWEMVDDLDSHQLFPVIAKRFTWMPKPHSEGYLNQSALLARTRHLFGTATRGEIAKAVTGAGDGSTLKFEYDDTNYIEFPSKAKQNIHQFLSTVSKRNPGSPAWAGLLRFAELNGDLPGFESATKTALRAPKLTAKQRASLQFHQAFALLKLDQVETALPILQAAAKANSEGGWEAKRMLGALADLLKRPELYEDLDSSRERDRSTSAIFDLIKRGKLEEAKKRIIDESASTYIPDVYMSELLATAVKNLDGATVLEIVDTYEWSTPGMSQYIGDDFSSSQDERAPSLEDVYLKGLIEAGRISEASEMARKQLFANPKDDDALFAFISAEGDAAIPLLDKLAAADPYQERPLIWKAKRLQMSARLDEAAAVVKAAIKIDPSDGETKGGRRMVVYSVYADILEAQGNTDDAQLYRNAVAAVRKSEDADKFLELGMTKRAIRLYKESLDQFSDAYCIQSRLAHQLATMGRRAEAMEHYRRAYELMSSSFGYVETHCFGCEHVFEGEDQQQLAETIFLEQLRKAPEVPQNHYLLGYLREDQGRNAEAATHFRQALQLAPNYANAAKHLLELKVPATNEERVRWAKLVSQIQEQDNWYQQEDKDYRKVYLETLAKLEMFGIKGDPTVKVDLKLHPSAMSMRYEMGNSWSNRGGAPSEAVSSSRTLGECQSLIEFLNYESNTRSRLYL